MHWSSNQNVKSASLDRHGEFANWKESRNLIQAAMGANLSVVKSTNRGPRESLRVLLKDPALKIPLKLNPERKDTLTGDDFCEFIKKHHNLLFSVFIGPQRHRG